MVANFVYRGILLRKFPEFCYFLLFGLMLASASMPRGCVHSSPIGNENAQISRPAKQCRFLFSKGPFSGVSFASRITNVSLEYGIRISVISLAGKCPTPMPRSTRPSPPAPRRSARASRAPQTRRRRRGPPSLSQTASETADKARVKGLGPSPLQELPI